MSVSSVSAIGAASVATSSSASSDYEEVKQKLKALGIASTGNEATDKALLQAAEAKEKAASASSATTSTQKDSSSSSQAAPSIPTELQTILSQLGIETDGQDIDTLISKASSELSEKLADKNLSEADKTKFTNLQNQLTQFQSMQSPSAMAGASALAAMNKSLLVDN